MTDKMADGLHDLVWRGPRLAPGDELTAVVPDHAAIALDAARRVMDRVERDGALHLDAIAAEIRIAMAEHRYLRPAPMLKISDLSGLLADLGTVVPGILTGPDAAQAVDWSYCAR